MSEETIRVLNEQLRTLQSENAKLRDENAKRRVESKAKDTKIKEYEADILALDEERKTLGMDRDTWKTKAETTPTEHAAKVKELETAIRTRDHRDAFREAVAAKLHPKASIEDVWAKINYEPGEALPTAEQLTELVGKAQEAAPYLFKSDPPGGDGRAQAGQGLPASAGGNRGGPDLSNTASEKPITAQLADMFKQAYGTNPGSVSPL
jgi:hypothetical protein